MCYIKRLSLRFKSEFVVAPFFDYYSNITTKIEKFHVYKLSYKIVDCKSTLVHVERQIKKCLRSNSVIKALNLNKLFIITINGSDYGIRAIFNQGLISTDHLCEYRSRYL